LTSVRRGMIRHSMSGWQRHLVMAATCLVAATATPSWVQAQRVVLMVNGEAITDYDIGQRAKFNMLASHKAQPRQEIIEELIDDKLKAQIARRYQINLTDKDVDSQYADIAKRMGRSPDELTQALAHSGIDSKTLKAKILSDLSWQYIVRGKFQPSLVVSEQSVTSNDIGYDYTLHPILFLVTKGNAAPLAARRKDAEALRARFTGCDSGLPLVRTMRDVIVRTPITRNSSDIESATLREILSKTELGHLTPPEMTPQGVQLFALCEKKETTSETPEKRARRDKIFGEQFQAKSKSYLRELRRQAMIEPK
jgi:peptidyl-prolyl cis-trans isomerase SurA